MTACDIVHSFHPFAGRELASGGFFGSRLIVFHVSLLSTLMRVLIVDDLDDASEALGKLIRNSGHIPEQVSTMAQAIAVAARWDLDAAFINVNLHDGNAQALASLLREKNFKCIGLLERGAPRETTCFTVFLDKPIEVRDLLFS